MFGLFRPSITAPQVVSGIFELLEIARSYHRRFCTDAGVAEAENYEDEESALIYFIGMHAIHTAKWDLALKSKVLTTYAAHIYSKVVDDGSEQPVEFFQTRFSEYHRKLLEETSKILPMDGVINHFLNALGVDKKQQGALHIALGVHLLSQLVEISKVLNDMNSKLKIV